MVHDARGYEVSRGYGIYSLCSRALVVEHVTENPKPGGYIK